MGTLVGLAIALLALCGAPLFSVFGAAALLLFARLPATPLSAVANDVFSERFADSPILVTIPLFTLAGVVLAETGASHRLVAVSRALLGWMPGGLAVVCIGTSALFTTFTGGSGITIVAVGGLLLPALLEEKYPERFSLGLVTAGGSLGLLLPPSLPIIIYGVVASVDIESLFIASFLPGLVTLALLCVYSALTWKRSRVRSEPFDGRAAVSALWAAKWELLLPVALLAGLLLGVLRIHEAAAFTALYVLVIELFVYRELSVRDVPRVIRKCVTLVGAILIIMATAIGFTAYLIQASIPQLVMESMQTLISSKWTFLLLLNVFLIFVGMLMDIFSAIIVVVPLIVPVATHFGVNPYHLGAIFLLNLEIGYLAPPVGLNLFLSSFRFERPMVEVYRAVAPFIVVLLACLGIVTYAPSLSTWSSRLVLPLSLESVAARGAHPPEAREAEDLKDDGAARHADTAGRDDRDRPGAAGDTLESLMQGADGDSPPQLDVPPADGHAADRLPLDLDALEALEPTLVSP
jgi:C4-dicarboxylate transporter DctM subunit